LELFFGDPPELFDRMVSFLDAYSLGRFCLVHPLANKVRPEHWQKLLQREPAPPNHDELPVDPILKLQVWTKLHQFVDQMEILNGQHFYIDDEFRCRCTGRKIKECTLPNLFLEAFDNSSEERRNRYNYFVRLSYRSPEGRGDQQDRLVWQGFCERMWEEGDDPSTIWLNPGGRMTPREKDSWTEMRSYLSFRQWNSWPLRNVGTAFGQHMKVLTKLHKLLSVTVVALDRTDSYRCHLVLASAGQSNPRGRMQRRHSNPHRTTEGQLVVPFFNFFQGQDAGQFPYLCVRAVQR
jgi:hypothetical protein